MTIGLRRARLEFFSLSKRELSIIPVFADHNPGK